LEPEIAFGIVLKKHRKHQKLSQEKLSESANLDRTYISLLERGQRQPSLKTILSIAGVLGVTASDLVREIETLICPKVEK